MALHMIEFSCDGTYIVDVLSADKDQQEFEALNELRDSFPDLRNFEISSIKEVE